MPNLLTITVWVCYWPRLAATPAATSPELQLQKALPDVAAVQTEQSADIPRVCPHIFSQTQQPQVAAQIQLDQEKVESGRTDKHCQALK